MKCLVYLLTVGAAGFDAPFNMGSAKGEIEWNSIFQGKYLMDYIN